MKLTRLGHRFSPCRHYQPHHARLRERASACSLCGVVIPPHGPHLDTSNVIRYYPRVISSFRDRDTERLFNREPVRRWGPDVLKAGLRKLRILDAATTLEDIRSPAGNRLEKLAGDRAGEWSIRVNDQWRVCFRWREGDAYDVEMVDYH